MSLLTRFCLTLRREWLSLVGVGIILFAVFFLAPRQRSWFGSGVVTVSCGLPGNRFSFTTTNPYYETILFHTNIDLSISSERVTNRWCP